MEEEGFVISNKIRKALFIEIASGETSLNRIIRKHRLIEQAARRAAEELKEHGIIEEGEEGYRLTELGAKIYGKLKGSEIL